MIGKRQQNNNVLKCHLLIVYTSPDITLKQKMQQHNSLAIDSFLSYKYSLQVWGIELHDINLDSINEVNCKSVINLLMYDCVPVW